MTLPTHVRTHKLSADAFLCAAGFNLIGADSPAIEAMTDFSRTQAVSIPVQASVNDANAYMISRGVRLLVVVDGNERIAGLITARDILGEKPVQVAQARGVKHEELLVRDLMTPIGAIDTLYLDEVLNARVADILDALKQLGRQHILIEDTDPVTGLARVRGLFSATHIGRLLGVPVLGFDLPRTFAEIEAALAG
ncbi:CBS domain-containing protein [Pseudothauera nasutitermitis]|nr:CBS domain-containing protein [Pseudothauera nasutitermitis]